MLPTSMAVLVMSSVMAAATPTPLPIWHRDYAAAHALAARQSKPLAVFVGHGDSGVLSVIKQTELSSTTTKLLKNSYVCMYVDTDSESGKKLSTALEMTSGIVISDRTGGKQALRYEGQVSEEDLKSFLIKYSDLQGNVTSTETLGVVRVSQTVVSSPSSSNVPSVVTTPQTAYPSMNAEMYQPYIPAAAVPCRT